MDITRQLHKLKAQLEGDLLFDDLYRKLYATDASVYRMLPLAVALPKTTNDIKHLIAFAHKNKTGLIPRTAGTSLAGQCIGHGIVVDVSKYFTKIIKLDVQQKTVTVQPGVVRDTLNRFLKPYGLFFGPNTSTSNRCMIGGMVGNNSSGTTSIKYGVTRDKVLALKTILSDGSEAEFKALTTKAFKKKMEGTSLENQLYKILFTTLYPRAIQDNISKEFPKPSIHRKNTGYALDALIESKVFMETDSKFNMCKLLSGSEGTLAISTEITLQLDDLPPQYTAMVVLHFCSISNCLKTVKYAMSHDLFSCEMMDNTILELTKHNKTQEKNRVFIQGKPAALLLCELRSVSKLKLQSQIQDFLNIIRDTKLSYAAPVLFDNDITKAMELRKAGLGLLGNMIGDKKAVACIEDTAVALEDLESYISEFTQLMKLHKQNAVYYAHAGAGELHLRPILNLKAANDVVLFRTITTEVAHLVKKYNGSMSGEHGDGIVRSEFIPMLMGEENYKILKIIKSAFDPHNIFNPGKIVDALPMDENLRYKTDKAMPHIETLLDFSTSQGILREAEKCNGAGDCRKTSEFNGTMCPSYRATGNEKDTTRARANALREYLTHSDQPNRFNYIELKTVFDLCLSCKACASECPSSVDVAALKAEFLYQYQKANGVSFADRFFAKAAIFNKIAAKQPILFNAIFQNRIFGYFFKKTLGIHSKRSLPKFTKPFTSTTTISGGLYVEKQKLNPIKTVYFFVDTFTNYIDTDIAKDAQFLLEALNYKLVYVPHHESGRALISKGFLEQAKTIANKNITIFKNLITEQTPLIGIEPSAILTFRDEYLRLANDKIAAKRISEHCYLIEEFLQKEMELGHIDSNQFTNKTRHIKFHGHCYQKALASQKSSFDVLNLPKNYKVTIIASGCCGMAGSFGYEKEHYNISMAIGNQKLFGVVKKASADTIIAANGTSCRHQIKDGTGKIAKHPVTILREALLDKSF